MSLSVSAVRHGGRGVSGGPQQWLSVMYGKEGERVFDIGMCRYGSLLLSTKPTSIRRLGVQDLFSAVELHRAWLSLQWLIHRTI